MSFHNSNIEAYYFEERHQIEKSIIGACLIENTYSKIADILEARNFSKTEHSNIWKAFGELWPDRPIDLRSTNNILMTRYNQIAPNLLADCIASVHAPNNIQYWSYLLLEIDIRSKFLKILQDNCTLIEKDIKQAADEIYFQAIDYSIDIFDTILYAQAYLQKLSPRHRLTKYVQKIYDSIEPRIQQIKLQFKIKALLDNIESVGMVDPERTDAVNRAKDLYLLTISAPRIPVNFASDVAHLNQKFLL